MVGMLHFDIVTVSIKSRGLFFAISPGEEHVRKLLREVTPPIEPTIE